MRNILQTRYLIAASALLALAMPAASAMAATATTTEDGYHVMVMTHLCNANIKTWEDFQAMESGRSPVENIARDVLACPTTGLVGDAPVAGTIASPRTDYDFTIKSDTETADMKQAGMYMPEKLCESDVGLDLDGNGVTASTTCLDISHYDVPVASGSGTILKVQETKAPAGFHLGALRWTPSVLDGNNDAETLAYLNTEHGRIDLNMSPDKDGMVMLHLYQFMDNATGTTTPPDTGGGTGSTGRERAERPARASR